MREWALSDVQRGQEAGEDVKIPVVTKRQRSILLGDNRYPMFETLLRSFGVPAPEREHVFYPTRKWRSDYCWPQHKLAVEIDGGVFTGGRHTQGSGFRKDQEKRNAYAIMGYRVMSFTPREARNGKAAQLVRHWFALWTAADVGKPREGDQLCSKG